MVHETKLLTFWRAVNSGLGQRGARHTDLDTAATLFRAGFTADEAVDALAPPVRDHAADAGLAFGWSRGFDDMFV